MPAGRDETADWERLAALVRRAERWSLRSLAVAELEELSRLYRRAAAALAREQTQGRDPRRLEHLNHLVARTHSTLYGQRPERRWRPGEFFGTEVPQTFRRHLDAILLAATLFLLFSSAAFALVRHDARWAESLSPAAAQAAREFAASGRPAGAYFEQTAETLGPGNLSGFLLSNNVRAALMAYALGITAGVGTVLVLAANGAMLGVFLAVGATPGSLGTMVAVIAPHGLLELMAFMIAGGAGLVLGGSLLAPGDLTRGESLRRGAHSAVCLAVGVVPLLGLAALVEGLLSPQSTGAFASNVGRLAFGAALAAICLMYLFAGDMLLAAARPGRSRGHR